jgi:predicted TIM-barrel fold metal-dependent hydrolase
VRSPRPADIDDAPAPRAGRYLDAHVHPWPSRLYAAVTRWFDTHAWPIAERVDGDGVEAFLAARGIERYVALAYAHRPGMAGDLNRWMAAHARAHPRAIAMATVHPDDDIRATLAEAFGTLALRGLKLHTHVMGVAPDDPRLFPAYAILCERGLPLVIHAGTEPASPAYPRPCEEVSGLARLERVLSAFPGMRCVLPHLGAGEFDRASRLLDRFPGLVLDCAMVLSRYFPGGPGREFVLTHRDRILYGTDFPILPYEYDRERRCILALGLGAEAEEAIFWGNAARFFGVAGDAAVTSVAGD